MRQPLEDLITDVPPDGLENQRGHETAGLPRSGDHYGSAIAAVGAAFIAAE
jgi:hypothetical protein